MDVLMDEWIDEWMDGWMDEWMYVRMKIYDSLQKHFGSLPPEFKIV